MLSLQYIRENSEYIIERLKTRNNDYTDTIEKLKQLDEERRSTQQKVNTDQSELNALSKKIGQLFREGKTEEANEAKNRNTELKQKIKDSQNRLNEIEGEILDLLTQVPNVPHPSVVQGKGEEENQFVRSGGETPQLVQNALPHWELGKKYDILDFDLGNKITGRGFPLYKDKGSRLQRAMINFFLDKAREEGYQEMLPPLMVNEDSAFATGQLPDKEGQMYAVPIDNFYLIPTAEVPVTDRKSVV